MHFSRVLALELLAGGAQSASSFGYGDVHPLRSASGQTYSINTTPIQYPLTLSKDTPLLTLDFGSQTAGIPFFAVASLSEPAQIEVKYAEAFVALANPNSDGPWTFSNGLAGSFRVETFNLTEPGVTKSFFVQGGQRWMSVRLLLSEGGGGGDVVFDRVGFEATSAHVPPGETPGKFASSDAVWDGIWDLGANNVQVACVDAGNAPSTWSITPEGALVRGQQTAQSSKGVSFANYTLTFETKIVRGGTGWTVASGTSPYGAKFYLAVDYDKTVVFANTNTSLLPSNTLTFGYPWSIVNRTTLETGPRSHYPVSAVSVEEDRWYTISTAIQADGYNVSIDGTPVAFVPASTIDQQWLATGSFGSGSLYNGTWGFGPWQDQVAYVRNVRVTGQDGASLYQNDMTSEDVLEEFSVAPLTTSVCLDGAKRDRLVWIGDFYHTARILSASTARFDYVLGVLDFEYQRQKPDAPGKNLLPISPRLGATAENEIVEPSNYLGLLDYQFLFLAGIGDYYRATADIDGLRPYWSRIQLQAEAMMAFIDPATGLLGASEEVTTASFFLGPANGSAVTALASYTYQKLASLADGFGDAEVAATYEKTAADLSDAVNRELWNDKLGVYSDSLDAPSNFSMTAIAWTILSDTANSSQAASMVENLSKLRVGPGYKTDTADESGEDAELSPNISGFLLDALFYAHRSFGSSQSSSAAKSLLDDFWSLMVTQDEYYSGAGWEYMHPDGSPGLDLFTSLAHPWGAAPTYVLPEYVLGVTATSPGFKTFEFRPLLWDGLGLEEVNGTVVTAFGSLEAGWKIVDGGKAAEIFVLPPAGTTGVVMVEDAQAMEDAGCAASQGHRVEGGVQTVERVSLLR